MNGKKRDWYWINTNRKVTYAMQFAVGQVCNVLNTKKNINEKNSSNFQAQQLSRETKLLGDFQGREDV